MKRVRNSIKSLKIRSRGQFLKRFRLDLIRFLSKERVRSDLRRLKIRSLILFIKHKVPPFSNDAHQTIKQRLSRLRWRILLETIYPARQTSAISTEQKVLHCTGGKWAKSRRNPITCGWKNRRMGLYKGGRGTMLDFFRINSAQILLIWAEK